MNAWWARNSDLASGQTLQKRAVAYYRHSAEIGQENSVEIQQDNIRAFALKHNLEIIHEFADRGKSGLNAEGRPAFNEMMEWVRTRDDFDFVLVLDVSRWGRFQDLDLSALYKAECTRHQKKVVYTNVGFANGDELMHLLRESIDRYQAADYVRGLSKKVHEGCIKVARQGYRPGGPPPYGFHRMMLDENKKPDRILQPGQRKAIQNGRVILVPGNSEQVSIVQEIFVMFVEKGLDERQIAGVLNERGLLSPGGRRWSDASIVHILTNQQYAGAVVYNKTTRKLKTPARQNPRGDWVITPNAYDAIVTQDVFDRAQAIFNARKRRYSREEMLKKLNVLYEKYAIITSGIIKGDSDAASTATYRSRFGSLAGAFKQLFESVLKKAKDHVASEIGRTARLIDEYEDFLVVNSNFTILIQPSVPIPNGYENYWEFRPDRRSSVDITLGVPLSSNERGEILGYIILPRLTVPNSGVRLTGSSDAVIEMHGHSGLQLIRELMV